MKNEADGYVYPQIANEMWAFDQLPQRTREFIRNSKHDFPATLVLNHLNRFNQDEDALLDLLKRLA